MMIDGAAEQAASDQLKVIAALVITGQFSRAGIST